MNTEHQNQNWQMLLFSGFGFTFGGGGIFFPGGGRMGKFLAGGGGTPPIRKNTGM